MAATAKKEQESKVVELGGNIEGFNEKIREAYEQYIELGAKRDGINAEMQAIVEGMEALGIPRKSFRDGINFKKADPEQRKNYDNGVKVVRDALDVSPQYTLPI